MYILHGCLFVTRTDFCPFLQDKSKYALEFSGCRCGLDRHVSIIMICDFFKRSNHGNNSFKCPYCKAIFPNLSHKPDCVPASVAFDLSCIKHANVLKQHDLEALQEDGRSFPRIFGLDASPPSEIDEIREKLHGLKKVRRRRSHLPKLHELSEDDAAQFFSVNPDEGSDTEPETTP